MASLAMWCTSLSHLMEQLHNLDVSWVTRKVAFNDGVDAALQQNVVVAGHHAHLSGVPSKSIHFYSPVRICRQFVSELW